MRLKFGYREVCIIGESFKFKTGDLVYFKLHGEYTLGTIISRKRKDAGLFKPKIRNVYLVKYNSPKWIYMIFKFAEDDLWERTQL